MKEKIETLKEIARRFKREVQVYRLVMNDPRTPTSARVLLGIALAYALNPIDLIPDWIPVLGMLDDILIVPLLVLTALKRVPPAVIADARQKVSSSS